MQRDLDRLTARTFDLLVVGGGVYGLIVACDAAQRGLAVALIERADFGSGASFNHHRTIHGGLRYLQTLDLARARESVAERRTFARIAPWAVRPVPFVLPLGRSISRGPLAMRLGFALDRFVARDRNEDVPASHRLPPGRVIPRAKALDDYPALAEVPFATAAVWHDYVTTDADRLTLAWGLAAAAHGATLANYVEATALRFDGRRVIGVTATDRAGGRELEIAARVVVNATGSTIDRLLTPSSLATRLPMLKAMNLITRRDAPPFALGARAPSGRNLFMVPWQNRALFGTWESADPCPPTDVSVTSAELSAFLSELRRAFPSFSLDNDAITLVHRGIVPAKMLSNGRVALDGRDQVHDHAARSIDGLISVAGTKYTTARAVAERVTDQVAAKLARQCAPCRTATTLLEPVELSGDALLAHAARNEMVVTLEDAVVRRTPIGALGYPGDGVVARAANIVGGVLGWGDERRRAEQAALRHFYD